MWAHLREDPPPLESHPALDPVLQRGVAQERDDRYPTCAALIDAAREVLQPARRRGLAFVVAGLTLIAVAIAGVVLASPPAEKGAAAKAPEGNVVAAIAPDAERAPEFVASTGAPSNVAVGAGGIWFLHSENNVVSRIDPETKTVAEAFAAPGVPTDLAVGAGAVWVATGGGNGGNWTDTVYRIDPKTTWITQTAEVRGGTGDRGDLNGGFTQIAVGAGGVWATGGGPVTHIDPRTGAVVATVDATASRIAAGREGVWFISLRNAGVVTPIDPDTDTIGTPIRIGEVALSGIAVGGGSVWVTAEQEGIVWRITPGKGKQPIEAGSGVNYIAYGAGAVWVANSIEGTLSQIDPATNKVVAKTPIGAVQSLAAGAGVAWVSTAGATRAGTLPTSACTNEGGGPRPDVLIASDLPLHGIHGGSSVVPLRMADAVRTVLSRHGFRAGRYTVGYRSCDDSTAQAGAYEPRRCAANANAYAAADRLVAVIGPQNSGCASVEIPILNRAAGGPLAMISPANTDVGLTRPGVPPPFSYRGTPDIYYPIGTRHYVRLVSPESIEGAAHAVLAKQLGLNRVYVLDDGRGYWKTVLADPFRQTARKLGVGIAGSATFEFEGSRFGELAREVERSGADGVVVGGSPFPGTLRLIKALRARLGDRVPIMVGSELSAGAYTSDLFHDIGPGARGLYVATVDASRSVAPLTPAARRMAGHVAERWPMVLETAQATEVVLRAIARSDGTRASVLEQLQATKVKDGILGTFRFDQNGDITPAWVPILRITKSVDGIAALLQGAVVDRVIRLPTSVLD
jgi:branched-chain amino acid transport system substrate-binding protein